MEDQPSEQVDILLTLRAVTSSAKSCLHSSSYGANRFVQPVVQVRVIPPCPAAAKLLGCYRRSEFLPPLVLVFPLNRGFQDCTQRSLKTDTQFLIL